MFITSLSESAKSASLGAILLSCCSFEFEIARRLAVREAFRSNARVHTAEYDVRLLQSTTGILAATHAVARATKDRRPTQRPSVPALTPLTLASELAVPPPQIVPVVNMERLRQELGRCANSLERLAISH